jgi:hypothetical protein
MDHTGWKGAGFAVQWLGHALVVHSRRTRLVIDPGPSAITPPVDHLDAVILTSGRMHAIGGLLPLLGALAGARTNRALTVVHPLGDDRAPAVTAAWQHGWSDDLELVLDAVVPGQPIDVGDLEIQTFALRCGEPAWSEANAVRNLTGMGLEIRRGDARVVWVPSTVAGAQIHKRCTGAALAVLQVGAIPWPKSERPWRMTVDQAVAAAAGAEVVWLVGDDGEPVRAAETEA